MPALRARELNGSSIVEADISPHVAIPQQAQPRSLPTRPNIWTEATVEPSPPRGWIRKGGHIGSAGARLSAMQISYYASGVESLRGQRVTEQELQDWADEAESGYDVEQLRRRGRKPIGDGPAQVVPVRIDATLLAALSERAERDHVSRSEAIRAAIRSYVA